MFAKLSVLVVCVPSQVDTMRAGIAPWLRILLNFPSICTFFREICKTFSVAILLSFLIFILVALKALGLDFSAVTTSRTGRGHLPEDFSKYLLLQVGNQIGNTK